MWFLRPLDPDRKLLFDAGVVVAKKQQIRLNMPEESENNDPWCDLCPEAEAVRKKSAVLVTFPSLQRSRALNPLTLPDLSCPHITLCRLHFHLLIFIFLLLIPFQDPGILLLWFGKGPSLVFLAASNFFPFIFFVTLLSTTSLLTLLSFLPPFLVS